MQKERKIIANIDYYNFSLYRAYNDLIRFQRANPIVKLDLGDRADQITPYEV
jgi:hypothetical protein